MKNTKSWLYRSILAIAVVLFMIFMVVGLSACGSKSKDEPDGDVPEVNVPDEGTHEHSYTSSVTKQATCTEAGEITYTCSCGDTYTESIPATGHTWDEGTVTTEATCGTAGEKTYTCEVCGETKTEAIAATGNHIWDDGVVSKAATETEDGEMTYTCTVCGATYTEVIPATGTTEPEEPTHEHSYTSSVTKEATCTEAGEITYTCEVCGETYTEPIAALGHDFGDWTVTTAATCEVAGAQTRTCSRCEATETQEIAALGHDYGTEPTYVNGAWVLVCTNDESHTQAITDGTGYTFKVSTVDELTAAVAIPNATVVLQADIATPITVSTEITLDLNGFTLSDVAASAVKDGHTVTVTETGSLTILDSSADCTGKIVNSYSGAASTDNAAAIYTLGTVVLTSGTIESSSVGIKAESGEVTINGGTISSTYFTIWEGKGIVTVTISAGTIVGKNKGIVVIGDANYGYSDYQYGALTTLNITGGTIVCENDSAICTLGLSNASTAVINISGGYIVSKASPEYDNDTVVTSYPAVYVPNGTLTISGGVIAGMTAVEIRGGTATISGGTFICTATDAGDKASEDKSGAKTYGYALAIYPYGINSSISKRVENTEDNFDNSVFVVISGGTFEGGIYVADEAEYSVNGSEKYTIGDDNYKVIFCVESYDELIYAATLDGVYIVLGADIEALSDVAVSASVTIDLSGYTLDGTIKTSGDITLTITDTSTDKTGWVTGKVSAQYSSKTYLVIEGGTIEGDVDANNLKICGGTFNGHVYGYQETIISGGVFNGTVQLNGAANYTKSISGGTFTGTVNLYRGTDITGGEFSGTINSYSGTVSVTGGTFTDVTINIRSSGSFSIDGVDFTDDNHTSWTLSGDSGSYTASAIHTYGGDPIYSEDGKWHKSCTVCGEAGDVIEEGTGLTFNVSTADELTAAVAIPNATVVLQADIATPITVSTEITLDLNGFTLSDVATSAVKDGHTVTVTETGSLTILDSSADCTGKIVNSYSGAASTDNAAAIYTLGTVVLTSGTIESSSVGIKAESGNVTINGGTISSTYFTIWEGKGIVTVTISAGTIVGENKGIVVIGDANYGYSDYQYGALTTLNITGGTIVCENDSAICTLGLSNASTAVINISGGYIVSKASPEYDNDTVVTSYPAVYVPNGTLTISGGVIAGMTAVEIRGGTAEISGGTFICTATDAGDKASEDKSGAKTYGYALAIYPYGINSSISKRVENTEDNFDNSVFVVISGGTFEGGIYVADEAEYSVGENEKYTIGDDNYKVYITDAESIDRFITEDVEGGYYWMGGVMFEGTSLSVSLSEDGYTYVVSATSIEMTDEQYKAFWVTEETGAGSYITLGICVNLGETVTMTSSTGKSATKTNTEYDDGLLMGWIIETTDMSEDFYMTCEIRDEEGNLVASFIITFEVEEAEAEQEDIAA